MGNRWRATQALTTEMVLFRRKMQPELTLRIFSKRPSYRATDAVRCTVAPGSTPPIYPLNFFYYLFSTQLHRFDKNTSPYARLCYLCYCATGKE